MTLRDAVNATSSEGLLVGFAVPVFILAPSVYLSPRQVPARCSSCLLLVCCHGHLYLIRLSTRNAWPAGQQEGAPAAVAKSLPVAPGQGWAGAAPGGA